jgi:hypothetical protein
MLQQVFVMLSKLDEIISSWESMPVFAECTQLVNALDDDILDDDGKVTKPGKQSTKVRLIALFPSASFISPASAAR